MKKEICDGAAVHTDLFTDENGVTWNFLIREQGSVSLYGTSAESSAHLIAWDSLDKTAPSCAAEKVLGKLSDLGDGIEKLLEAVEANTEKGENGEARAK